MRATALVLAGALATAACAPAPERAGPRFGPEQARDWLLAAPHGCSGPLQTPFGARFAPDGTVRDFADGPVAGRWRILTDGAVCVRREDEAERCYGLTRSQFGVAVFLTEPADRLGAALRAPLAATRPDAGRSQCAA